MIDYGARPPKVDLRDYKIKAGAVNVKEFELNNLPTIKNQLAVNSCVAHSSSSILEWFNNKETNKYTELSTGFIYGMQGVEFNRLESGMYLRDACKIVQKRGDCLHKTIPFNIEMPECYEKLKSNLNKDVYDEALTHKVSSYAQCKTSDAVKYALMKYSPVLISVKWYSYSGMLEDGTIYFNTDSDYGYHAVMVYGFNEKGWLCQNSWGKTWGKNGRFILPYEHGFVEAWSFVDAKNDDVHKPKQNTVFNVVYKVLNSIINFFKKR
jgi:C1A family cysteine protease